MVLMRQGRAKQRHDAIAHDLVHGPFVAMDGVHHPLQHRIEELTRLLRVTVGQEFHRALQIGEEHRDLFALTFERIAGGEDLLRQIGGGVGEGHLARGLHGSRGGDGSRARVARPDEAAPRIVADLGMGIEEFLGEIVQGVVIQLKLPLEGPIGHAAPLAQQRDHLIHDRDKVHSVSSLPGAWPPCVDATPS